MPSTQNLNECGWFYHAPTKRDPEKQRVDYPAPSNIPGIGYDDPASLQREPVKEMVFRETDSEYIRLAKMGGRKDLLTFNPSRHRKNTTVAMGYPRNDWFYLEDNRIEDEERKAEERKQWQFMLPDYMVHKSYKPSFEDPRVRPTRSAAPYHTDATSVMRDEGNFATDKTVKLEEHRRPGYGVRNQRSPQAVQKLPPREKASQPQDSYAFNVENKKDRMNVHIKNRPSEKEEPTNMSKLLAGEYERQWYTKLTEMQQRHQHQPRHTLNNEVLEAAGEPKAQQADYHHQPRNDQGPTGTFRKQTHDDDEEEKELFKLNRFKNIPSKLNSHQKSELLGII